MEWIILGYIGCCVAAFLILCDAWRWSWYLSIGDALFFAIISILGPLSLASAIVFWLVSYPWGDGFILWRRK